MRQIIFTLGIRTYVPMKSGYEPNELPLLHPAMFCKSTLFSFASKIKWVFLGKTSLLPPLLFCSLTLQIS